MPRLYANENFPLPVVEELRRLGHDLLTVRETGKAGQAVPDAEVLRFSTAEGRILLTLNRRHFIHLHETGPDHAGIVTCTFDPDFPRLAQPIHEALAAEPMGPGRLLRVNRPS
jgi:hypothetical protein